jgi:type VI secretion system protein ImpM
MSRCAGNPLGFYGKVPALGDFVSRRLPRSFIDPWDAWLQSALLASRETLAENWLSVFLVSPIWRFALSPGLCGPSAWVGVMMPSVDRVGRYFPLTLAQGIDEQYLSAVFSADADWFAQLENLALTVLNADFDLENFDKAALAIDLPSHVPGLGLNTLVAGVWPGAAGKQVYRYAMADAKQTVALFPQLSLSLLGKLYPSFSFWETQDSRQGLSRFLCCESMPPIAAYVDFLSAEPQHAPEIQHITQTAAGETKMSAVESQPLISQAAVEPLGKVGCTWVSHGMTVVGNKRKHNEDAMLNHPQAGVWVVADGMGGHLSGDIASRLIVDSISELETLDSLESRTEQVCTRLIKINQELARFASGIEEGSVVGSTVVVLLAKDCNCAAIWAGDSRLYRFRQGILTQLTRDHTLVDELMLSGLSRVQALQQTGANVITRAVGGHADLELDKLVFTAEPGDRYLLCSDGLDKELADIEISRLMANRDCQAVVESLINQALANNGRDNITVVIAEFS